MTDSRNTQLLVLTSLHSGSGDKTSTLSTIGGVGSARLHLQPMIHKAIDLGLQPKLLSVDIDRPSILNELGDPHLCVIGKINHFDDFRVSGFAMAILSAVACLKSKNVKLALMYCDHLAPLKCPRGMLYRNLLALSDQVIVPCQAMADRAQRFLSCSTAITVIEDPWQVRLQQYNVPAIGSPLRLGWFGNANNIIFLSENLGRLMRTIAAASSVIFTVLTNKTGLDIARVAFYKSLPNALVPWKLNLVLWDDSRQPNQLEQVLGSAHVIWLPSNPQSPIKGGVSHNRLVDSVRSGSIVVSSEMQSYCELRQLALLGPDQGTLINNLLPEYGRIAQKHESLRSKLLARFSPQINAAMVKLYMIIFT